MNLLIFQNPWEYKKIPLQILFLKKIEAITLKESYYRNISKIRNVTLTYQFRKKYSMQKKLYES